jgi:AraC family transcriptional regulator
MIQQRVSHGRASRAITVGNYRLTEACYAPGQQVERHEHAFPSWTFVLSGSFEESFAREAHICQAGSVLSKPSTADHSNRYGAAGAHCLIVETLASEEAGLELTRDVFLAPRFYSGGVMHLIGRKIHREFNADDGVRNLSIQGLLIELAAASARRIRPDRRVTSRKWLNSVRDQLEAEFRAPPSLSELAATHNLHPVYVCQEFRAAFGVSAGEFVRRVRFEWAQRSLKDCSGSISDIAHLAGYSDQAHFSRDCKARTGMSPRRYRMQA